MTHTIHNNKTLNNQSQTISPKHSEANLSNLDQATKQMEAIRKLPVFMSEKVEFYSELVRKDTTLIRGIRVINNM